MTTEDLQLQKEKNSEMGKNEYLMVEAKTITASVTCSNYIEEILETILF